MISTCITSKRRLPSLFFDQLDAPTLERITYDASPDFTPLLGLLRRIENHITHLSVTNFEVPTELVECLKRAPLLVALDVSMGRWDPSFANKKFSIPKACSLHPPLYYGLLLETNSFDTDAGEAIVDEIICEQLCPRLEYLAYHIADWSYISYSHRSIHFEQVW